MRYQRTRVFLIFLKTVVISNYLKHIVELEVKFKNFIISHPMYIYIYIVM